MTHPMLRGDDRFRRPEPVDEEGRNRFRELAAGESPPEQAAPAEAFFEPDTTPAYQPHYEAVGPHRAASIGFLAACGLILSLGMGGVVIGWVAWYGVIFGLLGIMLCLVSALQAYEQLQGIAAGAIEPSGRDRLVIAWCAAMCGMVFGLGMMLWGFVLLLYGVVDLNV